MNSKTNRNAIRRYASTETVCVSDKSYVTNPIETNAFNLFTNSLSYYKTKYQHKHFDRANEPYKITFDKSRTNAYIRWNDTHTANVSLLEQKQIAQVVTLACDYAFANKIELNVSNIKDIVIKECPKVYFNDVSIASVIMHYKKSMQNNSDVIASNKKVLSIIKDMFNNGVEISTNTVKAKLPSDFYMGCTIVSELVAHFKRLHKNDKPCWVMKKLNVISKGAKRLGVVVK